jgi:hemerythrin
MPVIEWSSELSIGVEEIDAQHREVVRLINELGEAMRLGKSREVLGKVLEGLVAYTHVHFATEEAYFRKFGYEGRAEHEKEHAEFVEKVADFKKRFEEGQVGLSIRMMGFLSDWLVSHIQGSDQEYAPLFREKGLK